MMKSDIMTPQKTVLIIGANSDVAKELALLYLSENHQVLMASRNVESMKKFIHQRRNTHQGVSYYYLDVLATDTHASFYENLSDRPHIVVYAAGFLVQNQQAMADHSAFQIMAATNYTAAVSLLNLIANDRQNPHLERIIGLSSLSGTRGRMSNFIYGSTKAAFEHYLEGLRQHLATRKVVVNIFVLGYIDSKINKGLVLNQSLMMTPQYVAKSIKNVGHQFRHIPNWKWKIIYQMIRLLPENILAKLP